MAGDPMGSIDLHQSASLCAQPEAAQDNPQNLSTARTTVLCYVYQTFFSHPHTKEKKKRSGYTRLRHPSAGLQAVLAVRPGGFACFLCWVSYGVDSVLYLIIIPWLGRTHQKVVKESGDCTICYMHGHLNFDHSFIKMWTVVSQNVLDMLCSCIDSFLKS